MRLIFFIFLPFFCFGQIDYTSYQALLQKHVSSTGVVDYKGMVSKKSEMTAILQKWSSVNPSTLQKDNALAFYINLYNLSTLHLIAQNYPVKSIKDIAAGKPWDIKSIKINGQLYSLNELENNLIRATYKDARVHFSLNCGALSCPPLLNKPYIGTTLNQQLDAQTKAFINNKNANKISASKITISKIFDWYKVDFANLINFLNKYSTSKINDKATIAYNEYSWALNGK
jgi:Protein of unknown function, DUF547